MLLNVLNLLIKHLCMCLACIYFSFFRHESRLINSRNSSINNDIVPWEWRQIYKVVISFPLKINNLKRISESFEIFIIYLGSFKYILSFLFYLLLWCFKNLLYVFGGLSNFFHCIHD